MARDKDIPNKRGRPSIYTPELANRICELVATHTMGLPRLCAKYPELPEPQTINAWRREKLDFSSRYAQAKMEQAELMAEEILEISDDSTRDIKYDENGNEHINSEFVARSRLRVDTRKWLASKLAPKIYGDRSQITLTDPNNNPIAAEALERQKALDEKNKKDY